MEERESELYPADHRNRALRISPSHHVCILIFSTKSQPLRESLMAVNCHCRMCHIPSRENKSKKKNVKGRKEHGETAGDRR